jgi:plastocyanin
VQLRKRVLYAVLAAASAALVAPLASTSSASPPHPQPGFVGQVPGDKCVSETSEEKAIYGTRVRYGEACKRVQYTFGPIVVKPGQNEAMIQPVTIEKPAYDGYLVRFKPDLLRAVDGQKTQTDVLHLHHATWLNLGNSYGDGPFFAAGEEKTISTLPQGYGMEVKGSDSWGLLYMVHNATTQTEVVWITYDIDFIPKADGDKLGLTPVKPIWLDVQKKQIAPGAPSTSSNPVFNVQKGSGHVDAETQHQVCAWPKENCAKFDTYGNVTPQQGKSIKLAGSDWTVPEELSGTLIGLGGHLHPGGIRDEVSLVRKGKEKTIFISDALYWDTKKPGHIGAQPNSWNLSMTITGAPLGWKVKINKGDVLRLNALYDSELASWYEGMGIVVAYVAPDDKQKPAGVDVFSPGVTIDRGVPAGAPTPKGQWLQGSTFSPSRCTPNLTGAAKRLCIRGMVTHSMVAESSHTGGCPAGGCPALTKKEGQLVTDIHSAGFTYGEADLGVIEQTGIPLLKVGQQARFWNEDAAARIWHTYTRCKEPCTGQTGVDYPIADGGSGKFGDPMDFDSGEIGYGLLFEPAKSQIGGNDPYDEKWLQDATYWTFTPKATGTFTFWCRIHPSMRGAFKVVK